MDSGWLKIPNAAKYIDVSPRTMRSLLKEGGLKHSRLKSGTVLISRADLDEYLEGLAVKGQNQIDVVVNDVMREFSV